MSTNPGVPATTNENLVTLLGGVWLTAGLFIDGYAHGNVIDTATEDFFTPWHGIFYSGFTFTAGWIAFLMYRRRNAYGLRTWIPPGYGWAVVGIVVFAVGGIGDGIWHTIFGVETSLDALLSPTHLLLLYGLIVILAAPLQAVVRTGGSVWMAITSVTILALLAAFFTTFARPLGRSWALTVRYSPNNDLSASWMAGGVLVTTMIMAVSALYLIQRFDNLPFGTVTILWTVPAFLEAVALSDTRLASLVAGLSGGLVADTLLQWLGQDGRGPIGISLAVGAMVSWAGWTAVQHFRDDPVVVPAEIWTGQIVMSAFVVGALTLLAIPSSTRVAEQGSLLNRRTTSDV